MKIVSSKTIGIPPKMEILSNLNISLEHLPSWTFEAPGEDNLEKNRPLFKINEDIPMLGIPLKSETS